MSPTVGSNESQSGDKSSDGSISLDGASPTKKTIKRGFRAMKKKMAGHGGSPIPRTGSTNSLEKHAKNKINKLRHKLQTRRKGYDHEEASLQNQQNSPSTEQIEKEQQDMWDWQQSNEKGSEEAESIDNEESKSVESLPRSRKVRVKFDSTPPGSPHYGLRRARSLSPEPRAKATPKQKIQQLRNKLGHPRGPRARRRRRIDQIGDGNLSDRSLDESQEEDTFRSWDDEKEDSFNFESDDDGDDAVFSQRLHQMSFDTYKTRDRMKSLVAGGAVRTFQLEERKEYRVKPYHCFGPDPVYMTEEEIYENMLKSSEHVEYLESFINPNPFAPKDSPQVTAAEEAFWGNADDGRIGSLRVEVLSCIGLAKQAPNVSVYLVAGDCAFATDTIPGSRSPMWPAQSRRAAVFPLHHAYVELFVGVFELMNRPTDNDEFCGRVVIDVAALRPGSEYDVTLPLRASSFIYDRKPRGVVRLRFSVHWFSERAACMSYLSVPHNLATSLAYDDSPSILCADPKTFRNVAVTVHGKDLPGKYTRRAFQATMREFNLYMINLRFLLKTMALDTISYEKPLLSLYVFSAWMWSVYSNSVTVAPAFFVGFIIYLMVDSYTLYARNEACHMGYAPVTIQEILCALLLGPDEPQIEPAIVKKRARKHAIALDQSQDSGDEISLKGDFEPLDHREFPFSEKLEYPKLPVEDALVKRQRHSRKEVQHMVGRLSVYVQPGQSVEGSNQSLLQDSEEDDDDDSQNSDMDETVHGDEDNLDPEDFEDEELLDSTPVINEVTPLLGSERSSRRIPTGPVQNSELRAKKKIPPQVHLARLENLMNKVTGSLSMDRFYATTLTLKPQVSVVSGQSTENDNDKTRTPDSPEASSRRKRRTLDDFDKRLGLQSRHANPVHAITSSFLGPLMRIFRVICFCMRVTFNIGVWKDPFLSFWVLCGLVALFFLLLVFPWRKFLCVVGFLLFGPQNVFLRGGKLEMWIAERKQKKSKAALEPDGGEPAEIPSTITTKNSGDSSSNKQVKRPRHKLLDLKARLRERRQARRQGSTIETSTHGQESTDEICPVPLFERTAFSPGSQNQSSKKKLTPREIVVPYSRFRKERFYDWPPDPTVSRSSPVKFDCEITGEYVSLSQGMADGTHGTTRSRDRGIGGSEHGGIGGSSHGKLRYRRTTSSAI